jgi:ubiquinone/menaquinone biosynthesis C-methylase UbiE
MVDRTAGSDPKTYYQGTKALEYERRRSSGPTWQREHALVMQLLDQIGVGSDSTVLDAPVGTGRFLPLYQSLACRVVGLDISRDMLRQAELYAQALGLDGLSLRQGNLAAIDLPNDTVDVAVCVRFAHLVDIRTFGVALAELARVCRGSILVTVPVWSRVRDAGLREGTVRLLARIRHRILLLVQARRRRTLRHRESVVRAEFVRRRLTIAEEFAYRQSHLTTYWMFHLVPKP